MELKVKKIKKISVDSADDSTTKYQTELEDSEGETKMIVKETTNCSFTRGDTWELKKTITQKKLES